jgi:hypothetical protein
MTDVDKIILTSIGTIIGGLIILAVGQIIIKFFIDPYQEYRKLLGEIVDVLTFYANVNAQLMQPEDGAEAVKAYRGCINKTPHVGELANLRSIKRIEAR